MTTIFKKMLYVYNPASGSNNTAFNTDRVIECFQQYRIFLQPYRIGDYGAGRSISLGDILAQGASSFNGIIINGGDGTLNYVTNTMYNSKVNLPIGIIPTGTCNDFARNLGIPADIEKCARIVAHNRIIDFDIGLLNENQIFLNTCAGGKFVNVSYNTNVEFKKNFGPLAYYINAIGEVVNIKPFRIKITADENIYEDDIILFIILNGRNAAGLNNIIRHADMTDGMMDIMLIRDCSALELASLFIKILINESVEDKRVMHIRTSSCKIEGNVKVDTSIDGEKGPELPLSIRFINKGIKIWVPDEV